MPGGARRSRAGESPPDLRGTCRDRTARRRQWLSFANERVTGAVSKKLGKWIWIIGASRERLRSARERPRAEGYLGLCITIRGFALRNCSGDCDTTAIETAIDVSAILSDERRVVH